MNLLKIIILISMIFFNSCISKKDCDIESISEDVLDIKDFKGNFIFENKKGITDTLYCIDYSNILTKKSIKTITNYQDCGHLIEFVYKFRNTNEEFRITLEKEEDNVYYFEIEGPCSKKSYMLYEKDIKKDTLLSFKIGPCENSKIKEFAFKRLKIFYFKSSKDELWFVKKFIPNNIKFGNAPDSVDLQSVPM